MGETCCSLYLNCALLAKDMAKLDDGLRICASLFAFRSPFTLHDMHDCNREGFFSRHGFFSLSALTLMLALPCRKSSQYMVCNNVAAPPRTPQTLQPTQACLAKSTKNT